MEWIRNHDLLCVFELLWLPALQTEGSGCSAGRLVSDASHRKKKLNVLNVNLFTAVEHRPGLKDRLP